jgi:hypothetical protein
MSLRRILALVVLLALTPLAPGLAADVPPNVPPIDQLEPLPLSFWSLSGAEGQDESVRSAYLRGFFEATQVWAAGKPQETNAAWRYLRLIQGMNLVQVSNLLHRLAKEHPQYRERLTLSEALTGCVVRARTGLPLLDDETAQRWGLKPAAQRQKGK